MKLITNLPDNGADFIEIGMPFSDPMADGPSIQLSSQRALKSGMNLNKCLSLIKIFREKNSHTPIILMGYYNPIYKFGKEKFIKKKYKIYNQEATYKDQYIIFGNRQFEFKSIIKEAYLNRISLSSSGFYSTPKINFDKKKIRGRPFYYFCYGAAVSEVTIDTLTGENILERVDILHDAGKPINPALELGQIEGGFVQGQGWLTIEELNWKSNGQITTFSPSTYKIPAVSDIPKKFNVEIFKDGINKEKVVNKAKTTGEPPLMLAMSVFYAIKDAVASVGNYQLAPELNAPATPERILMSINKIKNGR